MAVPLFDDAFWESSHEVFAALRSRGPVHRAVLPDGIGVWVVCDYGVAKEALSDPRLSKDSARLHALLQRLVGETTFSRMLGPHMMYQDGEDHARLRRVAKVAFSPRRVAALQPRIEDITAAIVRGLPRHEPVDLIDRVASRVPLTVICELLGVPEKDRKPFRGWTTAMMEDVRERTVPASQALEDYFAGLIESKRAQGGSDLLCALVDPSGEGEWLSESELMGTCFLLLVAGFETTSNLIGNSVFHLLAQGRWREIGQAPKLLAGAIDELLRFDSPVRLATHRVTLEPVVYGPVTIPAGELVFVALQAANRDPARFDGADELCLYREASGHLAFGHGAHYCLGAQLGRLEAETVLGRLTREFPDARLAVPESQLRHQRSAIMNGYAELPVLLG
ncbi:cytochrome P450 [Amycolatopsis magusensis]|uniref:cytochrome P450 n=1 Tax=Amycolatopsis magusensis TaxID=882444 RepID=UPI0037A010C0